MGYDSKRLSLNKIQMKIIGTTSEGYICTVSLAEVKSILDKNDERRNKTEDKIKVGDELSFTSSLSRLTLLKDLNIIDSYKSLGKLTYLKLKEAKEHVEFAIAVVEAANLPLIEVKKKINESGIV